MLIHLTQVPNVKNVCSSSSWSVDVIAGLVQEDLEVTHNCVGPLPASPHTTGFRDLDPTLACCSNTMVDVDAKWKFGWLGDEEEEGKLSIS